MTLVRSPWGGGGLILPPPWWGRVGVGGMVPPPPGGGRDPLFSPPPGGGGLGWGGKGKNVQSPRAQYNTSGSATGGGHTPRSPSGLYRGVPPRSPGCGRNRATVLAPIEWRANKDL